jgi:hypothetical protein
MSDDDFDRELQRLLTALPTFPEGTKHFSVYELFPRFDPWKRKRVKRVFSKKKRGQQKP